MFCPVLFSSSDLTVMSCSTRQEHVPGGEHRRAEAPDRREHQHDEQGDGAEAEDAADERQEEGEREGIYFINLLPLLTDFQLFPFMGELLLLLKATGAARMPIAHPTPGYHIWGAHSEDRETPGIEPGTSGSSALPTEVTGRQVPLCEMRNIFPACSLQTSLLRRSVFQSHAGKGYPHFALRPMKNPLCSLTSAVMPARNMRANAEIYFGAYIIYPIVQRFSARDYGVLCGSL